MAPLISHAPIQSWDMQMIFGAAAVLMATYVLWIFRQWHLQGGKPPKDPYYVEALEALLQIKGDASYLPLSDRIRDCCIQARQVVQENGGLLTSMQVTAIVSRFSSGVVDAVYNFPVPAERYEREDEKVVPDVVLTVAEHCGQRVGRSIKSECSDLGDKRPVLDEAFIGDSTSSNSR